MMGITFLFASGDNGVASNGDNLCLAANGTAVPGPGAFLPNFPSTCPYVTAVGATQVDSGKSVRLSIPALPKSKNHMLTYARRCTTPRAQRRSSAPAAASPTSSRAPNSRNGRSRGT